jgi:hypothetical protein
MSSKKVYVFWDNSNVFISAKTVAEECEPAYGRQYVRIQFEHLFQLATAGREVATAICVGSVPPELETVWKRLESTGIRVEKYERGEFSGKEQGNDQCLQIWMLRALADASDPQIAVLLTGDGQGFEEGAGFHADLERMYQKGWGRGVARLVGIEGGVVSGVFNLESSDVGASDRRPRHDDDYHEA